MCMHANIVPKHCQVTMAPKEWSNVVTASQKELQALLQEHSKTVERMGWKATDHEEFCEHMLAFLKPLCRLTVRINKSDMRKACARAHLSLTPTEIDLFASKVNDSIKWAKRRLRDMGSGARLPGCVKILNRAWREHERKTKEKMKEESQKVKEKQKDPKGKEEQLESLSPQEKEEQVESLRSLFGLPEESTSTSTYINLDDSDESGSVAATAPAPSDTGDWLPKKISREM